MTGQHEEEVGEAVEVAEDHLGHGFLASQFDHASLGTTAYGAADVGL
jgi:hypothetical protein